MYSHARIIYFLLISLLVIICWGCESEITSEPLHSPPSPSKPYSVGTMTFYVESLGRRLPVQLWYPTLDEEQPLTLDQLEVGPHREELKSLMEDVSHMCARTEMKVAIGSHSFYSRKPRPVVLFSHCHSCVRFSSFSTAEYLARHGYIVAAPDHVNDTLYDDLRGEPSELNAETLKMRRDDLSVVLDALMNQGSDLPNELNPDSERVGVIGHSFGAVTAALTLQSDERFKAGVVMAAPIENPLTPGVSIASQTRPLLYLLAMEDNSITEFGNRLIRQNYEQHPVEAWKIEVPDAGHWSFSDICGLTPSLMAGCGTAPRQTNPSEQVTYISNERGRDIAATSSLHFFEYLFYDDLNAKLELESAP